ncbi:PREDICTED: uncharacterized protein LOC107352792 [Acropora digitifera]|uniref:uncharacterized protein LOC107352792 n=1 Tax=Acropora digitifera TaxID=70779 RepID=UPI00077AFC7C|nr:PREDICTED: uncharacterized protein LOC107352792 [Acropora digitifera]
MVCPLSLSEIIQSVSPPASETRMNAILLGRTGFKNNAPVIASTRMDLRKNWLAKRISGGTRIPANVNVQKLAQTWSNEICGCRCLDSVVNECTGAKMGIDVDCNCVTVLPSTKACKGAKLPIHLFLTLLTGQAVIILILICALVHWVLKRSRQNSDHSSVDKLNSNKSDEEIYHHYSQKDVESGSTDSLKDNKCTSYDDVRRMVLSSPQSTETDL